MKKLLITAILALTFVANAQKYPFHENYDWAKDQEQTDRNHPDEIYYYNQFVMAVEYEYDFTYGQFYKYYTEHYRVKLQTDLAIEEFNKVYISLEDVVALKSLEARIIKKDGMVKLDPDIKEFFSEEEDNQYYYFPVSGLEKGDELEIKYTLKMEPEYDGDQFFFQGEIPVYNFDFYFIAPNDSRFAFKGHNGFPEPTKVDTILHRNQWYTHIESIPAFVSEYFSEYSNSIMKLDVSLDAIISGTEEDYSPFQSFANILNNVYNVTYSGKEQKAIHAINSEIGVADSRNTKQRIRMVEEFMKTDFNMYANNPDDNFYEVVTERKGGVVDAIQMYMALFDDAQIAYEYGFISNRYDTKFDPEIESQYFLQHYFFYFPDVNEYMAPTDFSSRMGYLNYEWVPNHAFFVTHKKFPREAVFTVKPVPATKAKNNTDSTVINIKIDANLKDMTIDIARWANGYYAGKSQIYYDIYGDERRKEVEDDFLNFLNDRSTYKMTSIENIKAEDAFEKPLIIKGKVVDLATSLIETAGDLRLFKLGEVFGEYSDLTQIDKKKTDFVFAKELVSSTTVIIELPNGVKVMNPASIKTFDDLSERADIHISSQFKIEGNIITYKLEERWYNTRYSIDDKDELLEVFNFYADLSKMNLILKAQ